MCSLYMYEYSNVCPLCTVAVVCVETVCGNPPNNSETNYGWIDEYSLYTIICVCDFAYFAYTSYVHIVSALPCMIPQFVCTCNCIIV